MIDDAGVEHYYVLCTRSEQGSVCVVDRLPYCPIIERDVDPEAPEALPDED